MASKLVRPAFTILELLVVIVILAILAAITLVAYSGITNQAVVSSMQSDLSNASTALKAFQAETGNFPSTISTDCEADPTSTTAPTNLCLKVSSNSTYANYVASNGAVPKSFSLTVSNPGLSYDYVITSESKPTSLAPAPNSPVADWLATLQGDHYGNYYDLVGKQWATVTRSTPKTVYDPTTQHIYDVPANYLAVTPRSDGKSGVEAVVEEGRTNYQIQSDFESDTNNDGLANNWSVASGSTVKIIQGVHGNYAQRVQNSFTTGDGGNKAILSASATASGSFAGGEAATASAYVRGVCNGCTIILNLNASSDSTWLGNVNSVAVSNLENYMKMSVTYPALPSTTTKLALVIYVLNWSIGDSVDVSVDAVQVEKGAFATSYISTTTSTATRNKDIVAIPQTNWNPVQGTIFGVRGSTPGGGVVLIPSSVGSNLSLFDPSTGTSQLYAYDGATHNASKTYSATPFVVAGSWNNGQTPIVYVDGVGSSASSTFVSPTSFSSTARIGSHTNDTTNYFNGPIQRAIIYSSALSGSDVISITNAIKDGPQ